MTQTVREIIQADIDRMQAAADKAACELNAAKAVADKAIGELAAAKARLAATHPTLLAILERPVDEVVSFIRAFGPHIFGAHADSAAPAAQDSANPAA